jgi:outer membrane receptor protein involved in Fe transport
MFISTSLKRALFSGTAFAAMTIAGAASAQTAPVDPVGTAAAQADNAQSDEEVTVTGSRVARLGFQAPTPVTVITQEQIQNSSPSNNIADFVNQLPSVAGSTKPANSRLNLSSGQAGINQVNLRNADGPTGGTRTLVLLDGRRNVPSTINGVVDINTIPQALVKSIEVVTGGASAQYGSDAVAGVLNFILDKKYTGLKVSVDSGVTTYGDGANYSMDVTAGLSFAGGRGHFLISGEVAHRDGIFEVDRKWNATGFLRIQDPNWVSGVSTTPRYLVRDQIGAANSTPGSLILYSNGGTANRLRGTYFGQGGQVLQYQYGTLTYAPASGSAAPGLTQGGSWLVNDSGRRIGLDPEDDRHGLYGRLSFDVGGSTTLFAEVGYNKQRVQFNAGPNLASCGNANLSNVGANSSVGACTLAADNAYLIQTLGAAALAGITSVGIGTTAADLPYRGVDNRREVQRYTIGAEGELDLFGKAAPWNIYGQFGQAKMREQLRNIMHFQRTSNATDAVFAQAGNPGGYATGTIVCRINVDATTANDDRSCVPLNRLGLGVANPASFSYFLGDPYRDETLKQYAAGANISVTPFATWAGDVSVAVGAEYRRESITGFVPQQYQPLITTTVGATGTTKTTTPLWSVGNYLPSNGKYNVKEAYLEAVVPLGLGIEVNGAVRATDYSTAGYVTTWKGGATWQMTPDVRFRITRSRDIRAPSLADLFAAGSSNSDAISNPGGAGGTLNGITYTGTSISYTATVNGNPNLKPEKADTWNIGAVFTPTFIPGLSVSADYFRIDVQDAIGSLSAQEIANRCFRGDASYCAAIRPDAAAASSRVLITNQPFNFARQLVRGFDFDASYRIPMSKIVGDSNGTFGLRGLATYYLDNVTDQGLANTLIFDSVGVNGGQSSTPKWIFRASASYETPNFSVTVTGRGISKGKYLANVIECTTGCPVITTASQIQTAELNHLPGLFYTDLNLTQKVTIDDRSWGQFFINVTNVFNKSPLILPETGLAANSTYSDMLGRQFRVGFRAELK